MKTANLSDSEMAIIRKGLSEKEKEASEVTDREKEVLEEEAKQPWNVDTLSKPGFSKRDEFCYFTKTKTKHI